MLPCCFTRNFLLSYEKAIGVIYYSEIQLFSETKISYDAINCNSNMINIAYQCNQFKFEYFTKLLYYQCSDNISIYITESNYNL